MNNYLIKDSCPTLIDTGIGTDRAWEFLEPAVQKAGYRIQDIKRILVTHGHLDHYGMARKIVEVSGAEVFIHSLDCEKVLEGYLERASREYGPAWRQLYRLLDVPTDLVEQAEELNSLSYTICRQLQSVTMLKDGGRIPFDRFELEVIHTPGHSPGMSCFFEPESRILFCGDHILKHITPNPVLEVGEGGIERKPKSLVDYLLSLEKVHALKPSLGLPGHGPFIQDVDRLISALWRHHQIRNRKLLSLLSKGKHSVYSLAKMLFPKAKHYDIFLALSEIVGALEVLEAEGLVRPFLEYGLIYYRPLTKESSCLS